MVEILTGSGLYTRLSRGAFDQTFQIVIVIFVQAAHRNLFFEAPYLAFDAAVFSAGASFQRQSAVGPQLASGTKTMRRPDQSHRQRGANGPERRNLPALRADRMLPTLP